MTPRGTEPPVPCGMCKLGALGITSTCLTFIMNNKINFDQVGTEPPVPSDKEGRLSNKSPIFLCQLLSLKSCPLKSQTPFSYFLANNSTKITTVNSENHVKKKKKKNNTSVKPSSCE